MDVYIVGEDDACRTIIYRVIDFCSTLKNKPLNVISSLPARGGEIKSKIGSFNKLAESIPVILLADLDNNVCPPSFIPVLLGGETKNENFILSIAVDEVEAWLLADRENFASYCGLDTACIPQAKRIKMQGRVEKLEIECPYKTSQYFCREILPHSRSKTLIEQLTPRYGATKGPEYNSVMIPFIQNHWDIETAMESSDSLKGMVDRICRLLG